MCETDEIVAMACEIFGGLPQAENWMASPAVALGGQRPIDLLQAYEGRRLLTEYLGRLDSGSYS